MLDAQTAARDILREIDEADWIGLEVVADEHRDVLDALANGQLVAIPREGVEAIVTVLPQHVVALARARGALRAALAATTPREAADA